MDLEGMRIAVTLADELHFGRTAERLFLDPGTLTRRVQALERSLDCVLFERTSRRVSVTPAGERFVFEARAILATVDLLRSGLGTRPGGEGVRVGVLGFGIAEAWSSLRDTILTAAPETRFWHTELDVANQYEALRRGIVDIALVHYVGPVDGLVVQPVLTMPQVAVLPRSHPAADADVLTRAELADLPWIGYDSNDPSFGDWAGPAHPDTRADRSVRSPATMVSAVATTGRAGIHGAAAMRYYARPEVAFVPVQGTVCEVAVATRLGDRDPLVATALEAARLVDRLRQPAAIVDETPNDLGLVRT